MNGNLSPKPRGVLSARRFALLATTIAGLSAAAFVIAPSFAPKADLFAAHAQNLTQQAQQVAASGRLCRHRREGEAGGDLGARQDGRRPQTIGLSDERPPFPPGSPMERSSALRHRPTMASGTRRAAATSVTGQGSGFFISADGYAVTNNHVVDKAETVEVTTDDGKTYTAKVIGTDPRTDLALIKVDGRSDFPFVKLADKAPRIGDWVLAVGNPFGLGGTVTAGIVSARGRDIGAGPYDDFIQIDAPVNKGNSGGPTFDIDGNVIGVNTAIFSPSGGSVGIAFAIPADTVKIGRRPAQGQGQRHPRLDRRADPAGHRRHRRQPRPEERRGRAGRRAAGRQPGRQGRHRGRRRHHRGQRQAGQGCARSRAHRSARMAPGTSVKLDRLAQGRGEDRHADARRVAERSARRAPTPGRASSSRHATCRSSACRSRRPARCRRGSEGVVVTEVDPDGLAAEHGFKTGDVILEVGGKTVASPTDVRKALGEARKDGKHTVLMRVKSGEGTRFVALPLGNA